MRSLRSVDCTTREGRWKQLAMTITCFKILGGVRYSTIRYGTVRQAGNILKQLYGSYTKTGSRYVVNTVPGYSRRRAGSHEQRRSISRCSGKLRVSLLCCRLLSSTSASYGVSAPSNRVQFPTSKLNNPPTSDHGAPNRRPEGEKPSKSTGLQA
jgi:hypothetical protein